MSKPLRKVLLVDDDRVTNLLHQRVIERTGLVEEVDVATDGVLALEYLKQVRENKHAQPELILLDVNMPRMNGFEFLTAYAEMDDIPRDQQIIIMLSTSLLKSDHDRAEADPLVHRFANKPIAAGEILEFIEDYHRCAGEC